MKRLICILLPLVIGALLFFSCDIGGFQDLAEMIDPTTPIGENSYSYMRTTLDGTNNVTELITYSESDGDGNGELVFIVLVDDADDLDPANWKLHVSMIRADYILSDTTITLKPYIVYHNQYTAGLTNATQRDDPDDFDQIVSLTHLNYVTDDHSFDDSVADTLTYDSNNYTSVTTLYDNIMRESDAMVRAKQFMQMYELTIITSQTKIEGFGGMGMIQYLGRTVAFKGIRVGTFELTSEGAFSNTTDFNYKGYSDYQGLTIHGLQRSQSGTSGDGNMSGTVDFTLVGSQTWTGSVNYDAIVLDDTLPKGGVYLIKFDGIDDQGTGVNPLQTTNPGSFDYTDIFIP